MSIAPKHTVYILLIWFVANLFFLDRFPFVHSDEIWLGGLTRAMMQAGSFDVTEPFFDLQPRNPHALKILYHTGQSVFIRLFGFGILAFRLFSLVCGAFCLWLFFRLLRAFEISPGVSLAGMVMLSLDVQFLYASRFGRQEMPVAVFMLAGMLLLSRTTARPRLRGVCAGLCAGLAFGLHPNAFIAAMPVSLLYVAAIAARRRPVQEGLFFAGSAALSSSVFVFSSFMLNADFLSDYSDFGRSVGVRSGLSGRLADFPHFFVKLFNRISGTYYTPDIKSQLVLLCAVVCIASGVAIWSLVGRRNGFARWTSAERAGAAGIIGTGAGIFILGKFSQPSILFMIPFLYLCLASLLSRCMTGDGGWRRAAVTVSVLCVLLAGYSLAGVAADVRRETEPYPELQSNLASLVPPGARTFGNLSWGIPLSTDNLVDIRNLAFLEPADLNLPDYFEKNNIEYIVVSDELDFIYASRPVWNVMYGNPARWYPALRGFIAERCVFAGEFPSPGYGMRIVSRRYTRDWKIRVYRVVGAESKR